MEFLNISLDLVGVKYPTACLLEADATAVGLGHFDDTLAFSQLRVVATVANVQSAFV